MLKKVSLIMLAVIMLFNMSVCAEEAVVVEEIVESTESKIKVACVGDSITQGVGLTETYPMVLQNELGDKFVVENFGVSGTSALKSSKIPYVNKPQYADSLAFDADIVCIMFGTNDIKDENWPEGKDNFKADYKAIIDSYKEVNPDVKVYIGVPPAILKLNVYGERNPEILENEGIPKIKELAEEIGATQIDFFTLFEGHESLFPDFLHPNDEGAAMMAKAFAEVIKADKDVLFIGASKWAKAEIALSYELGLIPESVMTDYKAVIDREAFCEMVAKMFVDSEEAPKAPFTDVDSESVDKAYALGIINGVSETSFNPDANITREEMAAMLCRAFRKITSVEDIAIEDKIFPDNEKISEWAMEDVKVMNSLGVMKGDENGNIRPMDNTTNEEAILLVYRTFIMANTLK